MSIITQCGEICIASERPIKCIYSEESEPKER